MGQNMATYVFNTLKTKYKGFHHPVVVIEVNDMVIGEGKAEIPVSDISVELTSGFEASVAEFSFYDVYDRTEGSFNYEKVKSYIFLGSKVEIYLGYENQVSSVFIGVITRVSFLYEQLEIPCIRVTAMDVKGIMMSGSYSKQLKATCFSEAVKEVLNKTAYGKLSANGVVKSINVTDTPDKLRSAGAAGKQEDRTIEMAAESDYEFVVKAARKYNYEFFTECGNVYFRKAKSDKTILMEIGPGTGLHSFDVSYDITGLTETVIARGVDVAKAQVITAKNKFSNKISMGNKAKPLLRGGQKVYLDATITSKEEAQERADSLLEEMAYRFGRLEGELIGIPELLPGHFITLAGLGTAADNDFYLKKVRHLLRGDGSFVTKLEGICASMKSESISGISGLI